MAQQYANGIPVNANKSIADVVLLGQSNGTVFAGFSNSNPMPVSLAIEPTVNIGTVNFTSSNNNLGSVFIQDGSGGTNNRVLVTAFHNTDNQALGNTAYGLMTGGVDQLLNAAGNLDRKRAAYSDGLANTGVEATGNMVWNGSTFDRLKGNTSVGSWAYISGLPQATYRTTNTPTVTAATYGANKVIGGIQTFASILPSTYAGILESITIKFKASVQTGGFYVAIFTTSPTGTFTDTNTAAIASTDSAYLIGIYSLASPNSSLGNHTIYNLDGIAKGIVGSSTSLYVVIIPTGTTVALASTSDMIIELGVIQG